MLRSSYYSLPIAIMICGIAFGVGSVAGAPLPKAPTKISVDKLKALLGKNHLSKEVQEFRNSIEELPVATYFVSGVGGGIHTTFYHSWHDHGLSVQFDENGDLSTLFLYLEPKDGFKEYAGDLPNELERKDKSKDIQKKLGEPETAEDSSSPRVNAWWTYPKKGIVIKYSSPTADDTNTVIGILALHKPEMKD